MAPGERNTSNLPRLLHKQESGLLTRTLARTDDVQVAAQLDNLDPNQQDLILQLLPVDRRPEVLGRMRDNAAAEIVQRLAPEEAARLLDELESDDVVDILGHLDGPQLKKILASLDPEDIDEIEELLAYDEESAGGLMSPDFICVSDSVTVAEAVRALQNLEDPPEHAFYVYVLDEEDRLTGVLPIRILVTSKPDEPVRDVMIRDVVSVGPDDDQEHVADIASRYDVVSIPVIDHHSRMLGVITIDDIVDVLREEATEDILKMAGAGGGLADTRSFWSSLRARVPWLMAAAVGGLLVAFSLSAYENAMAAVPALALFMPVIAGMGGNVGTQSSTIVVRGLAVGYVESAKLTRVVLREVMLGVTLGVFYGVLIALCAPLIGHSIADPWRLGVVLVGGMVGSMTIAATVGASVPLLMEQVGVDPAVSTGPFVTTSVDILGLLFYFWLATVMLEMG